MSTEIIDSSESWVNSGDLFYRKQMISSYVIGADHAYSDPSVPKSMWTLLFRSLNDSSVATIAVALVYSVSLLTDIHQLLLPCWRQCIGGSVVCIKPASHPLLKSSEKSLLRISTGLTHVWYCGRKFCHVHFVFQK